VRAAEQQRADVQSKRRWWDILVSRHPIGDLVFLDETGANTKMIRRYGWGPKSSRVISDVPHGHWKTTTFLAALRSSGFTAPLVVDGPMNGNVFLAYVQQQLIQTLKPGDLVIMDNLSSHKRAGVKEAIESVGAELMYLPPYSPDLNPIELAFSKLKTLLRKAAARTTDELEKAIVKIIDQFQTQECINYFRHCGYNAN
jgi:transposase